MVYLTSEEKYYTLTKQAAIVFVCYDQLLQQRNDFLVVLGVREPTPAPIGWVKENMVLLFSCLPDHPVPSLEEAGRWIMDEKNRQNGILEDRAMCVLLRPENKIPKQVKRLAEMWKELIVNGEKKQ